MSSLLLPPSVEGSVGLSVGVSGSTGSGSIGVGSEGSTIGGFLYLIS